MVQAGSQKPCDQCHKRKVRCNYETPCNRCQQSGLACSYSIIRKKRGPRKGKGAVLNNLRSGQIDNQSNDASAVSHREENSPSEPGLPPHSVQQHLPTTTFTSGSNVQEDLLPFDDPFLTFDEFAHNILADNTFLPYGGIPGDEQQSHLGSTPYHTSGEVALDTPHTAFATTIALPEALERFDITPVIERSVKLWFEHQYPIYPLIQHENAQNWLQNPQSLTRSEQTMVWAISAMSLVMIDSWPDLGAEQRAVFARQFIRKCQQLRLDWDYMEAACFEDVLVSLFISITYFELKCRKASWFFVRQAITLASAAGLHDDFGYAALENDDQVRRRRAFALLYITERGAAMLDGFPVSVLAPPHLPDQVLPGELPSIAAGLGALHGLFSLLDMKFVKIWNDPTGLAFGGSVYTDLSLLQAHLRELVIPHTSLTDIQRADVLITQQWLRLVFWQAALKLGYISTAADDRAFTYNYPIEIAMALCNVVKSLPPVAIQVHGLGIFEKQFEIAYSLMDALALSGTTRPEHHECLRYLLLSLSASPASRQIYVKTLEKKMGGSQQKYSNLAGVELLRDDSGRSRQQSRRQSLDPGTTRRGIS